MTEGSASIKFGQANEVFYNKVQVFNRDLSTTVIAMFAEQRFAETLDQEKRKSEGVSWRNKTPTLSHWDAHHDDLDFSRKLKSQPQENGIQILEALSATGLRSIRYMKEIPGVQSILVNDIDEAAAKAIDRNIAFNDIDAKRCKANLGDAAMVMYNHRTLDKQFDVVDLDPYGSASVFVDSAVQCVKDGGLLAVTCTDLAVLCGNHMDACYSKYGSVPIKAPYCHEMALRIVLADLNRNAAKHKRFIVPLFCVRADFYVRLFVRVYESAKECRLAPSKISNIYQCTQCDAFQLQPLGSTNPKHGHSMPPRGPCVGSHCEHCGGAHAIAGPIWNRSMVNREFAKELLARVSVGAVPKRKRSLITPVEKEGDAGAAPKPYNPFLTTVPRIRGEVAKALAEVDGVPLFYSLSQMCRNLRCSSPGMVKIEAAITNAGYNFSQSATNPDSIKTDAPVSFLWDIFRQWALLNPRDPTKKLKRPIDENSPAFKILSKAPDATVDFDTGIEKIKNARRASREEFVRYQDNPEKYWGPKSRAKGERNE